MAETLLISLDEMTSTTILGGNVDFDKYTFCVHDAQIRVLRPLLGSLLYNKIKQDYQDDNLTGVYLELYNDYVKPIVKNESVGLYIDIAPYMVDNGGIFKHAPADKQVVETREVERLSVIYTDRAQMYIGFFNDWICDQDITEYTTNQDDIKPTKQGNTIAGWRF